MTLYIKNMVCNRCRTVVRSEFDKLGIETLSVDLGEVSTAADIPEADLERLQQNLRHHGFEILQDRDKKTIEKVRNSLVRVVYEEDYPANRNLSDILVREIGQDYSTISKLFSETEGITIEKYLINLRIERVKELLIYDELSLSEIAFKLNYSSTAYLSNQFKKVTGLSPSFFKKLKEKKRKPIDEV
ncbi:helix-turn-helix domain-containing protein [Flavilitoribacter nigricans]|uniref:AraC family transcriptional regulator n=1 Tax=Flavilitoribacter nigricans (strain ATCC 23147 / DSM 23189 / NBRC 102662 / NCIMB 1420 / SS-2) TaxID=1122177 RepID=A0A2D0NEU9_FLAN2|nr:AraC family transcriptional regulator [Flavilitoribacter nigricans]PHN07022.1 AraC family transcriptional regulator [Flavilitoribacter nigricans DSM 23189 = NBRC 102662]